MKYFSLFFSLLLAGILISGCSHTNELAKYNINGQGMLFNDQTSGDAASLQIVNSTTGQNKEEKKDLGSVLASIGSDILSETSKQKIIDAVKTDSMASYVSEGLKNALVTYLSVKPVESVNDNPQFIVETTLTSCKLLTSQSGVSVQVEATARIIDRTTGAIVWDDSETETVPIRSNGNYADQDKNQTLNKVLGAVQLASLSETEIQNVVNQASKSAGRLMGDTLREDIIKSKQK